MASGKKEGTGTLIHTTVAYSLLSTLYTVKTLVTSIQHNAHSPYIHQGAACLTVHIFRNLEINILGVWIFANVSIWGLTIGFYGMLNHSLAATERQDPTQ